MSKYIKLEDAIKTVEQVQGIICGSTLFADLPTIEVSEDAISREELLQHAYKRDGVMSVSVDSIKLAPSVIPSRPQGECKKIIQKATDTNSVCGTWFECSECGKVIKQHYRYCPNCGAKMKGADNE